MTLQGKNVLVLAADLFEDTELLYPVLRLREEGANVVLASPGGRPVTGKKGHGPLEVDADVADLDAGDFHAVVIPGGFAPDALRRSSDVLDIVRECDTAGKPLAFICHAGWVPISAGVIEGRRATSFFAIRDDMVNAGCDWVDEPTVVDGNFISARDPGDLGPWLKAIIKALQDLG
jgi:protease I